MGKCVAYVAAAVVFMGLGALVAGACVWFLVPKERADLQGIQEVRNAQCVFAPNGNGVTGTAELQQSRLGPNNTLYITANITGISPVGLHGFHIHTLGVPADTDCTKTGGHYNPNGFPHGAPTDSERHVGDLGNINVTDGDGVFVEIEDHVAKLWGDESVVGRAIVIHSGEDDLGVNKDDNGSQKTGNAGSRLACCTIYLV